MPADEVDPGKPLHLMTRVNGELRQDDNTARLTWDFSWLIGYITQFATLKPGDLIFTGTPVGAGGHQNPPNWLKPGDVVEVEVPEIGRAAQSCDRRNIKRNLTLSLRKGERVEGWAIRRDGDGGEIEAEFRLCAL